LNGVPIDDFAISSFISGPKGIGIDDQDSIYVFESGNHEGIYKFNSTMDSLLDYKKTEFKRHIAIGNQGSIYSQRQNSIFIADQSSPIHNVYFAPGGGADARRGIAFDSTDTQYVQGFLNNGRLFKYNINDNIDVMPFPKNVLRSGRSRPTLDFDRSDSTIISTQRNSDNNTGSLTKINPNACIVEPFDFDVQSITEPIGHDVRGFTAEQNGSDSYWYYTDNEQKLVKATQEAPVSERVLLDNSGNRSDIRGLVVTDDECIFTSRNQSQIVKQNFSGDIENVHNLKSIFGNPCRIGSPSVKNIHDIGLEEFFLSENRAADRTIPVNKSFTEKKISTSDSVIPTRRDLSAATKGFDGSIWTVSIDESFYEPNGIGAENDGQHPVLSKTTEVSDRRVVRRRAPYEPQNSPLSRRGYFSVDFLGLSQNTESDNEKLFYVRRNANNQYTVGTFGTNDRNSINSADGARCVIGGVDVTTEGSVWYTANDNNNNNLVRKEDQNGSFITQFTPTDSQGSNIRPTTISVDETGENNKLYMCDTNNSNSVFIFNTDGSLQNKAVTPHRASITAVTSTEEGFATIDTVNTRIPINRISSLNRRYLLEYSDDGDLIRREEIGDDGIRNHITPMRGFSDLTQHPESRDKIVAVDSNTGIGVINKDGTVDRRFHIYSPREYHELDQYQGADSTLDLKGSARAIYVKDVANIQSEPEKCIALHHDGKVRKHTNAGPQPPLLEGADQFNGISHRDGKLYLSTPNGKVYKYSV
jgi:hypothetical protein